MAAAEQLITANLDIWSSAIKAKSAAGRGKGNKLELYGIKKLRELILELAVRGLLVPQDPNDEPASELLKTIAAEKAQLIKAGKVKKTRSPSKEDVAPLFDIPASWGWARLSDIGSIFNGNSVNARTKAEKYTGINGLPYIATKDVGYGFEPLGYANGISIPVDEPKFKVAQQGAVLICSEGGSAGKKCGITDQDICFGNKLYANQLFGGIGPNYILSLYLTPSFFDRFAESMTGIIGGVSTAKFMQLPAPIPPLAEQARIVAKVDELMAFCDQLEQQQETSIIAHQTQVQTLLDALTTTSERDGFTAAWARIADHFDTLFTTEWSIDQLKQTILQLAVMGKLVPQDPNDEPISVLLNVISENKRRLIKEKKIKRQKAFPPINESDKKFKLPKGWEWTQIGHLGNASKSSIVDGPFGSSIRTQRDYLESGIPVTRMSNISPFYYRRSNLKFVNQKKFSELSRHNILPGDVLLGKVGSIGNAVIYPSDMPEGLIATTGVARFRVGELVTSEYLCYLLNALGPKLRSIASQAVQPFLNMKTINGCVIALPPLAEQCRIVVKADELMSLCDTLKTRINTAQTTQLQLADVMAEPANA